MRLAALPVIALCSTLVALSARAVAPGELAGTWTAELKPEQRQVQLNLRTGGDSQWGESLSVSELTGFSAQDGEARFSLVREAGTLRFDGSFRGGQGAGHYRFEPAAGFADEMAKLGYPEARGEKALHLALADMSPKRVREYQALGFKALPWDELFAFCLHDVTPDFVKELRSLGLKMNKPDDVVAMRIHDVTPAYVKEVRQAGLGGADEESLVELRIHDVTAAYAKEMRSLGLGELDAEDLKNLRIHDVTPEFVREMRAAGYTKATAEDLLKLRIHGVDKMLLRHKGSR